MRDITVAKSAGFCFGVERAVNTVYDLLDKGERVCTLGPIIHNPQIVEEFENRGVKIVKNVEEMENDRVLVIRSHGVSQSVLSDIKNSKKAYVDATCPFVSKIHRLVSQASEQGKTILIAGDANHPEVIGIVGYAKTECHIFNSLEELEKLLTIHNNFSEKDMAVFAQTTFKKNLWEKFLNIIKKVCTNALIFDTICNATTKRQEEAEKLAKCSDVMIVIGGKESSNTAKLFDVCSGFTKAYHIETAKELPHLHKGVKIGITAGASTPDRIIKEVLATMIDKDNNEMNFEELLEESLKNFNTDEKVRGVVVGITPNEVYVDVGRKQAGFIPMNELSSDPNAKAEDIVKIGDEVELLIMKTNDQEGTIMLSKRRIDSLKGWDDLEVACEEETTLTAKVTEVVKGGVIIAYSGVRVFIPASQATANKGDALEALKGTEQQFRIIEINKQRRRAVGSIRVILREERRAAREKFWETLEVNKEFSGVVKSLTAFGAFVDIGGIDGMVHISELSWGRIKHPKEVVAEGDNVVVYIKEFDKEKNRISLGYKRAEDNPWTVLERDYPVGTNCEATIVSMTTFGAFARVLPGVDGLIHISQISDTRIEKPSDVLKVGETVNVKITDIDFESKRVSLSIRAIIEEAKALEDEEAMQSVEETEEA